MVRVEFLPLVLARVATVPVETLLGFAACDAGRAVEEASALEARLEQARTGLGQALHALVPIIAEKTSRHALLEGQRRLRQGYQRLAWPAEPAFEAAAGARTLESLNNWNELVATRERLLAEASALLESAELPRLRRQLSDLVRDSFFMESLFLASPALLEAARRYEKAPPAAGRTSKSHRKTERSLIEHLARICFKTTPRSILTAVHLGRLEPSSAQALRLTKPPAPGLLAARRSLIVLPIVQDMARSASQATGAWRHVVPRANPTLRREAQTGKLAFWKRVPGPDKEVLYRMTSSPVLEGLLELARPRQLTAQALIERLCARFPQFTPEQMEGYYKKLCEQGLMIGHFEIPLEVPDGLSCLIQWLSALPPRDRPEAALADAVHIRALLQRIDDLSLSFEARGAAYQELALKVSGHHAHAVTPDRVVMVDSASRWRGMELGSRVVDDLRAFLGAMAGIAGPMDKGWKVQDELREHFASAYPGRESVDVLETYAPAAEKGALWKSRKRKSVRDWPDNPGWRKLLDAIKAILSAKERAGAGPVKEARLNAAELPGAAPDGFTVGYMRVHLAQPPAGGSGEPLLVLEGSYPFLAGGFARWGYLFASPEGADPVHEALSKFWRDHVAKLWPGKTAGVCFQAVSRTGLVNAHPTPQPYVVEWQGARSGQPTQSHIALGDLYFSLDPKGEVAVRSKADPSTVVFPIYDRLLNPRDEPMIDLMNVLSVSRNLSISLRSEPLLSDELGGIPGHIPRLLLGNVVVARETWVARASFFHAWNELSPADCFTEINRWRARLGIPRFAFAHSCDSFRLERPQPIDFWNPFLTDSLQSFFRTLKPETEVWIMEMLPGPDALTLSDESGRYAQELVIGFALESKGADASKAG